MGSDQLKKLRTGIEVQLNSGGPLMTVTEIEWSGPENVEDAKPSAVGVECAWFDEDGKVQTHSFPAACLRMRAD